jgi:hypothetical protein
MSSPRGQWSAMRSSRAGSFLGEVMALQLELHRLGNDGDPARRTQLATELRRLLGRNHEAIFGDFAPHALSVVPKSIDEPTAHFAACTWRARARSRTPSFVTTTSTSSSAREHGSLRSWRRAERVAPAVPTRCADQGVDDGQNEHREQGRRDQPADHDRGERPLNLTAWRRRERHR